MTIDINLTVPRRLERDEVVEAVKEATGRDAVVVWENEILDVEYFNLALRDPNNRRVEREIRVHVSNDLDVETQAGAIYGQAPEYTYLTMGAHGGAPSLFKALGERFGGLVVNESLPDDANSDQYPEPGSSPLP